MFNKRCCCSNGMAFPIPGSRRRCSIASRFGVSAALRWMRKRRMKRRFAGFGNALRQNWPWRSPVPGSPQSARRGRLCLEERHVDRRDARSKFRAHAGVGIDAARDRKRSSHDPDANWTRHGARRQLFFGYKAHIAIDQRSGLIRARKLTGAKTYESEVADDLVLSDEKAVYADKAYEKWARRDALKARGVKDRIQHRRNKHQTTLPRWQAIRNKLIGRVRQAIERTFSLHN